MILTIDVGLRNLALCCMSTDDKKDFGSYKIHLWNVYNLLDSDDYKCKALQKSGKVCNKKCSFTYKELDEDIYSCKTHFPKTLDCKVKKHIFKKKIIKNYLLQDIAECVISKIQNIYEEYLEFFDISCIQIELQPKINRKAMFTSHIIYGKLIDLYKNKDIKIKFVKASHKLKAYTGPIIECKLKNAYSKRKWLAVEYTRWFLINKFSNDEKEKWLPFFESKVIKPDMSDTFLMVINALYGIPKK